jgi:hypothetical protein
MPGQTAKTTLAAALGQRGKQVHEETKSNPVSGGGLPAGINRGVAQLTQARVGKYDSGDNQGKPYVLLMGVAKTPEEHDGVQVAGQLVGPFMFPMCDTPKRTIGPQKIPGSLKNWYNFMLDHVGRLLGVKSMEAVSFEQMDGILEHLQKDKPYFNYSTAKAKDRPDPKDPKKTIEGGVFTNMLAKCEYNGQVDPGAGVTSDETSGEAGDASSDRAPAVDEPSDNEGQVALADLDVDQLLEAANGEDDDQAKPYRERLLELAAECGVEGAADMPSWDDVAASIKTAQSAGDEGEGQQEETSEPEAWKPEKGAVVKWKPTDAKGNPLRDKTTKKPLKAIEIEVVTVNEKKETVTAKNNTTKKMIVSGGLPQAIPWADLIHD